MQSEVAQNRYLFHQSKVTLKLLHQNHVNEFCKEVRNKKYFCI